MTIHSAKGLEFRAVFMPRLVTRHFPGQRQSNPCPLPDGLGPGGDPHHEEREGLFFVALSRARDVLSLSRAARYGPSAVKASKYLDRLAGALQLESVPMPRSASAGTSATTFPSTASEPMAKGVVSAR